MAERLRMSPAEFLDLPETNQQTELIEGHILVSPAPTGKHQLVAGNIYFDLRNKVKSGRFVFAPADVQIDNNVFQPDIFWVGDDNNTCLLVDGKYWQGAPDLVIEILSPATAKRDRDEKFKLYEAGGVREYWIVEPEADFLEVFVSKEGKFERQGVYDTDDTFTSLVLNNQEIAVKPLFQV